MSASDRRADFTGPIAGVVAGFVAFGISRGLAPATIFERAGIRPEDLSDPDRHVPASAMFALWELYLEELDVPALPLMLAAQLPVMRFGIVGELMKAATSVGHALAQYVRYSRLTAPHLQLRLEEAGPEVRVEQEHHPRVEDLGGPIEFMLALLVRGLTTVAGRALRLNRVTFKHAARGAVEPYVDFFGATVTFGQPRSALVFDATELARPLPSAAPETARYLEAHAARMLEALPPAEPAIIGRVREAVAARIGQAPLDQALVARQLAMSTRTLQRRLGEAGTSFNELVDDMRRVTALSLLNAPDTSITDAAFLLGYSDVPTFYRAFRRWTGTTPQAHRRRRP